MVIKLKKLSLNTFISLGMLSLAYADGPISNLQSSYNFLVNTQASGGILYNATAYNTPLPLSYYDSATYWSQYVCAISGNTCEVTDTYNPNDYTLDPPSDGSVPTTLQFERVNVHNGTDIYDAATWQIAVMLGYVDNGLSNPENEDAFSLVEGQNTLLQEGYDGNASNMASYANWAFTQPDGTFTYGSTAIHPPAPNQVLSEYPYFFRMVTQNWLSADPLSNTIDPVSSKPYVTDINNPSTYPDGTISWQDWKPITGENAWAFFIGPLQSAYLHYIVDEKQQYVPFNSAEVTDALQMIPAFQAMQSPVGAFYYAASGTNGNSGQPVPQGEVSIENNISTYAGLNLLRSTLQTELANEPLTATQKATISAGIETLNTMIGDGTGNYTAENPAPGSVLAFLENAWANGQFETSGIVNNSGQWVPDTSGLEAVDVNTWGIAAIGPQVIDAWHGAGAAYNTWQQVKSWGGYGQGSTLWGVGYSNQDGNGISNGQYKAGVMSAEWTAGAITAVRVMEAYYADNSQYQQSLQADETSMVAHVQNLQFGNYDAASFTNAVPKLESLLPNQTYQGAYLYDSARYAIPFGWMGNPLPSTCSTSWMIMVNDNFNPFVYGGVHP